jgi:MoaA/NifB/PqqE/SkfB family radical SAM enzyme
MMLQWRQQILSALRFKPQSHATPRLVLVPNACGIACKHCATSDGRNQSGPSGTISNDETANMQIASDHPS